MACSRLQRQPPMPCFRRSSSASTLAEAPARSSSISCRRPVATSNKSCFHRTADLPPNYRARAAIVGEIALQVPCGSVASKALTFNAGATECTPDYNAHFARFMDKDGNVLLQGIVGFAQAPRAFYSPKDDWGEFVVTGNATGSFPGGTVSLP
jgi:hypothetical protein